MQNVYNISSSVTQEFQKASQHKRRRKAIDRHYNPEPKQGATRQRGIFFAFDSISSLLPRLSVDVMVIRSPLVYIFTFFRFSKTIISPYTSSGPESVLQTWKIIESISYIHSWILTLFVELDSTLRLVIDLERFVEFKIFSRHGMPNSTRSLHLDYFSFVKLRVVFTITRLLFKANFFLYSFLVLECFLDEGKGLSSQLIAIGLLKSQTP